MISFEIERTGFHQNFSKSAEWSLERRNNWWHWDDIFTVETLNWANLITFQSGSWDYMTISGAMYIMREFQQWLRWQCNDHLLSGRCPARSEKEWHFACGDVFVLRKHGDWRGWWPLAGGWLMKTWLINSASAHYPSCITRSTIPPPSDAKNELGHSP